MKKNRPSTKKLSFNRETLKALTEQEADRIAGGGPCDSECTACQLTGLSPCYSKPCTSGTGC